MPGGPFVDPKMTPAIKERLEAYYGLDKPVIYIQFGQYHEQYSFTETLGYSMRYMNRSVNDILASVLPLSPFDLGVRALVMAIALRTWCWERHRGTAPGQGDGLRSASSSPSSAPAFPTSSWAAFCSTSSVSSGGCCRWRSTTALQYTILPSVALGLLTLATVSRVMRSSMLEVVGQDYIKTARSKGLSNFRITTKHEIRNAIIPIITILGPMVASILTGTFVIESIFAIPGMGKYYVDSINANDYTLIMGMTLFYGAVLILANMVVDILYGIVDPRIRVDKKSEA
jgi:oligopeptide transport system permease protein